MSYLRAISAKSAPQTPSEDYVCSPLAPPPPPVALSPVAMSASPRPSPAPHRRSHPRLRLHRPKPLPRRDQAAPARCDQQRQRKRPKRTERSCSWTAWTRSIAENSSTNGTPRDPTTTLGVLLAERLSVALISAAANCPRSVSRPLNLDWPACPQTHDYARRVCPRGCPAPDSTSRRPGSAGDGRRPGALSPPAASSRRRSRPAHRRCRALWRGERHRASWTCVTLGSRHSRGRGRRRRREGMLEQPSCSCWSSSDGFAMPVAARAPRPPLAGW